MPRSLPGPTIGLPCEETSPVVGSSKPATMRRSVDLPQPEAPIRQTNSPAAMVASTRASASISSSPTAKRLVTPRIASCVRRASAMVLRAPAQQAVRGHYDEAVGDEAAHADHDHAGDHQIGARQRAALQYHRAEAGRPAVQFPHDNQNPDETLWTAQTA